MEINYTTIMRYLCPDFDKNDQNIESEPDGPIDKLCEKNIIGNLNFLNDELLEIFKSSGNFYRIGITQKIIDKNKQINISFFSSILSIFDNKFLTLDERETSVAIKKFIEQIKESISKTSFKFELKYKFQRNVLMNRVLDLDFEDGLIYQCLCQILDLNILILESYNSAAKNIRLESMFYDNSLNPWRPTIILHKNKNSFEPILNEDNKLFSINDDFIRRIYEKYYTSIVYFNEEYLDKEFSLIDDSKQIIFDICETLENENKIDHHEIYHENNNIEDSNPDDNKIKNCLESSGLIKKSSERNDSDEELSQDDSNEEIEKKIYNKTNLKNMKKEDIMSLISKDKQMFVHFSKPQKLTKNELIEKFIFFQNMSKNKNSIQSSAS